MSLLKSEPISTWQYHDLTHRVEERVLLLDAEPRVLVLGLLHHLVALLAMVGRSRLLVVLCTSMISEIKFQNSK